MAWRAGVSARAATAGLSLLVEVVVAAGGVFSEVWFGEDMLVVRAKLALFFLFWRESVLASGAKVRKFEAGRSECQDIVARDSAEIVRAHKALSGRQSPRDVSDVLLYLQ